MQATQLIAKKRDGGELTDDEIRWFVNSYTKDELPDYQMAAWMMAVFFQGMTGRETAALTMAMAQSGEMVDLSEVTGVKVDKHSTGGVADTTTLILAPLVAAAGVPVAKMSGRGLGFTGGTIDKLEAIPGFKATLSRDEFIHNLKAYNIAITGQSTAVAPADGKMYALRDVTATVESIPLIASSIMSKKIAAGADKIVLDVKVGSGAFMKNEEQAIRLAEAMVKIGQLVGRETVAVLTSMQQPLGTAVGNSLEVLEAIEILSGRGEPALREVCLTLGSHMLALGGKAKSWEEGRRLLIDLIENGVALRKFKEFVIGQGGDSSFLENNQVLPQAAFSEVIMAQQDGFVAAIDASEIGRAAMQLGAGREYKGQAIDLAAGLVLNCRVGQAVKKGEKIATLYANEAAKFQKAVQIINKAVIKTTGEVNAIPLIIGVVTKDGFKRD